MPNTLTILFLAGALTLGAAAASALELPDYGSKNFSPSGDTPTYFTNETAPVAARTADTTANDWSAADAAAPAPSAAASSAPSRGHSGRHGKYSSAQRSGKHGLGKPRGASHASYSAKSGGGRSAAVTPARTAGKKPAWAANVRGPARSGPVSAAKTTTAKHGKSAARHARAAASYPAAMLGATLLPKEA